jgi:hypothetical protein
MTHDLENPQAEARENAMGRTLLVGNTIALVSAMTYDWTVNAIGLFELSEYVGLTLIYGALAVTAPFGAAGRPGRSTG